MDKKLPHWNTILSQKNFWFVYFRFWEELENLWEDKDFCQLLKIVYQNQDTKPHRISIKFPDKYQLKIRFYFSPEEGNVDEFTLIHPSFKKPLYLGCNAPHFIMPIFHWDEIGPIIQAAKATDINQKYIALLLIKAVWCIDPHTYPEAAEKILKYLEDIQLFEKELQQETWSEKLQKKSPLILQRVVSWDKNAVEWEYTNEFGWTNKTDISRRKKNETGEKIQKFLQICKNSLHSQT